MKKKIKEPVRTTIAESDSRKLIVVEYSDGSGVYLDQFKHPPEKTVPVLYKRTKTGGSKIV